MAKVEAKGVVSEYLTHCYFSPDWESFTSTGGDHAIMELGMGSAYIVFGYGDEDPWAG